MLSQPLSKPVIVVALFLLLAAPSSLPQNHWQPVYLPSGKVLVEPPAGILISDLNAFPINSATSPNGRYVAFLNNGYGHSASGFRKSIAVYDRVTGLVSDFTEPGTGLNFDGPEDICTPFYGLAFSSNGKRLYLSLASTKKDAKLGDRTQNGIRMFAVGERGLYPDGFIQIRPSDVPLPEGIRQNNPAPTPSGISVRPDADNPGEDLIYAALTLSDAAVELSSAFKRVNRVFNLHTNPNHPALPAEYPYATALSPDGKTLYVSLYNGSAVSVVDLATGKASHFPVGLQQTGPSAPSSHPSHLAVHPAGKAVFVAVENTDLVSIIDNDPSSKSYRQLAANFDVRTQEMKERKLWGAGPNHLTFAPDGKRLFVTLGLLNAVAVVRLAGESAASMKASVEGYLPTLWYPHTTEISKDGRTLFLTSGKGIGAGPNKPNRPFPPGQRPGAYGPLLLKGSLHALSLEEAMGSLPKYTQAVKRNNQLDAESLRAVRRALDFNPILHVIYVIKENRTYDQVFGDLENTRADKTCLYFGERFTPNQHKLARQFGILDNFFDSAEVSFNGHTWSTAGINSGWNEQQWQINYSTKNFTYDSEGRNNEVYPIEHNQSDVDTPHGGYIWDNVAAAGKTIGMYGEYCDNPERPLKVLGKGDALPAFLVHPRIGEKSLFPWKVPVYADLDASGKVLGGTIPTKTVFKGSFQPLFAGYDLLHPDILRFQVWKRDFDSIAKIQKETGKDTLPALSIVRMGNDHTRGVAPGGPTPDASVADNDLAVGMLVEAVSSDPYYWSNTAIIILEDDAQAGCDHVDSHRSIGFFISKYSQGSSQKPHVDSRFLTTVSALSTIEALLGLPPNNLMTATAPLMFTELQRDSTKWHGPYRADFSNLENGLIFEEATGKIREQPELKELADLTGTLDMEEADQADANALNYVLERWVMAQGRLACCK
ncbi:MAG: beta-propeller fold lactonase family protein [Acidobacteria bacterium]|nr:beta-propeller fold lactonase family protein [Acidobacteriota bacterium]